MILIRLSKTSHPVTERAIKHDQLLAEAIAMIHCDVDDFSRWNKAFRVLRRIGNAEKHAAALDVILEWGNHP